MDKAEFVHKGFQIVCDVLTGNECDRLIACLSEMDIPRGRAGARHLLSIPEVARVATGRRVIEIVRWVLGVTATPFRATLFEKSCQANWLVTWHQDTALPMKQPFQAPGWGPWSLKAGIHYVRAPAWALRRIVAVRLHLDDSGWENGPLRVIPGSHRFGLLTKEAIRSLTNGTAGTDCIVPKGGALAMFPLIVHASSKSQTDVSRPVLHIEYNDPAVLGKGIQLAVA